MRSERFAEGEAAQATVKELGRKSFWDNLSLAFVISGVASGVNAQTWSGGDPFRASCILIHPAYNQCEQERIRAMAPIATR
jgi:hypothetical protein